jgi:hypothetical protein
MTQHGLTLAQQAALHKAQKQGPVVTLPGRYHTKRTQGETRSSGGAR